MNTVTHETSEVRIPAGSAILHIWQDPDLYGTWEIEVQYSLPGEQENHVFTKIVHSQDPYYVHLVGTNMVKGAMMGRNWSKED